MGWGTHVNPWLIHVNVWQKPLQYYKVISLQLIKINGKKLAMRYLTLKRHDRNDNNFLFEKADKQGYIVQHRV